MSSLTTRKERDKERKQQEILVAAKKVFLTKGYLGTTMDEIAQEAEYSKGTLYSYFNSKYELFAMLSTQVLGEALDGFDSIASDTQKPGLMILGSLLTHWAETATKHIEMFRLAIGWMAANERANQESPGGQHHKEMVSKVIGHFSSALMRGHKDKSIAGEEEVVSLACQLWSGMMGALLFNSRNDELTKDFPLENHIKNENFMEDYISLQLRGLAGR